MPKYTYSILLDKCRGEKFKVFCGNSFEVNFCFFFKKVPETIIHIFCECDLVKPLWLEIGNIFHLNTELDSQLSNFEKVFLDFYRKVFDIFLCKKYFIYEYQISG